jgi:PAS domain S-box-containing protein
MQPGVPFALLGSVELLSVASWMALAGAALALRRGVLASLLVAAGSVVLAGAEVATALQFGETTSDALVLARVAGAVLLAAGLLNGALGERFSPAAEAAPGVIVPLAAAPRPALLAAAATAAAALAALRSRRDLCGVLLTGGLALAAAALVLSPRADDTATWTLIVVILRGLAAVAVLVSLVVLSRTSMLAKVVAAILAGVLAASAAALGVVGTVVVNSYQDQSNDLVAGAAQDRLSALNQVSDSARIFVGTAARFCPQQCDQALAELTPDETSGDFVVKVTRSGATASLGGRKRLTPAERLGLARNSLVRGAFPTTPAQRINEVLTGPVRLAGSPPSLAVIAIKVDKEVAPTSAVIYGVRLDDTYTTTVIEGSLDLDMSFLIDGHVVASNGSAGERNTIDDIAQREGVVEGFGSSDGLTVPAQGTQPTVHFAPVVGIDGNELGVLAVSRPATEALDAQQRALTLLFATALVATALVGGLALVLGRRTVDPVRRLTAAAARVSAGDLTATVDVRSADEVGTLSRTFDTMTGSLLQLTDDLRASAARLQTVLASMSDGLVATDAAGLVTSINPAALTMVGLSEPGEALGRPLSEVVDVRDAGGASLADPRRRLFDAAGEVHRTDVEDTVPVRVAVAPLESGDGVVLVLRDTSREREIERMKTEFLANVSHELRTPLTPIRGYAEILVSKPGLEPEKVTTFATTIRDESIKMNRVVDLLVDVAAIEAGRVTVTPRPVAVKELLDSRVSAWKERAPRRAKDIKRRMAAGLPPVMVDPEWVGKALDELVDNAVKYTPRGTSITMVAALHDGAVRVGVRDAGPGIAAADQRTLFTSFEQVDGSATRRVGGLGLGLSFVRRLAEDAGFPLSFNSVVGKGSEFSLDLPVSAEPLPRRASRARRRPAPARGRGR